MPRKMLRPMLCAALCVLGSIASAAPPSTPPQALSGPADAGRIKPEDNQPTPDHSQDDQLSMPQLVPSTPVPPNAKSIHFTLKTVHIEGTTIFTPEELADIYKPYLDKEITLDIVWIIAAGITERYRSHDYFLSRAYVPQQQIKNGVITIGVAEEYIGLKRAASQV